jgi:N-acetylglucosaminyl-diphospho-decaprenol L-rhamnosyltransferase
MSERANSGTIDVVIVNWNAGPLLTACLSSVAAAATDRLQRVLVIDNGSSDGSAEIDIPDLPLTIVKTGENLGFGRACNLGAAMGSAEFILMLNPDTEVAPDAFNRAAAFLDLPENADSGVVGIRLVGSDGVAQRHCARFPRWSTFVGQSLGLAHLFPQYFKPMLMHEFDHENSRAIDHVMGAFYLIRRSVFERLKGFDEDYFVYLEDLDLSYRVTRAGYRIHYLSDAHAYHRQGGTSEQVKAHRLFYSMRGVITYSAKHFSRAETALVAFTTFCLEPITRSALAVAHGSPSELWATWRAFGMLWGNAFALYRRLRRGDG